MKKMNRLFALLLALTLIVTLTVPVMATEGDTETVPTTGEYSITINTANEGHTYEAYMIFYGDLSGDTLSNIKWGNGVTHYDNTPVTPTVDATEVAKTLITPANAEAFAEKLTLSTEKKTFTYDETSKTYVVSNLPAGYYLVKDADNSQSGEDDAYTSYIIRVAGDAVASPKASVPTIEKKVSDINDSTHNPGSYDTHLDNADHDIGDDVPFHVHVDLGNNLDDYDTYKLVVTDIMSKGLTFNEDSVTVVLEGKTLAKVTDYTISTSAGKDDSTVIVFTFSDLHKSGVTDNDTLSIDYTAELNENAVIGNPGNPNTVYMEYSNNPNSEADMGKTPEDTVIVFTYKVDVNKVDGNDKALNGATFRLSKYVYGSSWVTVKEISGTDSSKFEFVGLDDGHYKLEETVTPSGYNTIDPIEFDVVANHVSGTLTELSGTDKAGTGHIFASNLTEGSLSTDVVNHAGATLPSTGGMGTTLFYVLGGLLVCAAVVLLITKKRMHAAE